MKLITPFYFVRVFHHVLLKRRSTAYTVRASKKCQKTDYVTHVKDSLNPRGFYNRIIGSKVLAIFSDWAEFPGCGVLSRRVCYQRGYPVQIFIIYVVGLGLHN